MKTSSYIALSALSSLLFQQVEATPFQLNEDQERISFGGDFRYRIIKENARKFDAEEPDNDRLWMRFRLRLQSELNISRNVAVNARFITEPRYYHEPSNGEEWVRDEYFFDRLSFTWRELFGAPVQTTVGRQGIRIADSWLVGEGTPLDGTRSDFFDAARFIWAPSGGAHTLDFSYIENSKNSSAWIRPINDFDFDNIEQDERGVVIYSGNEFTERLFLDPYFIYKKDHNPSAKGVEGETYTPGIRAHGNLSDAFTFNLEGSPQFGHKNGKDLEAFAANTWLQWTAQNETKPSFRFGYEYTSGDKDIDQSFDKLWGREALWSDLYTGGVDGWDGRELDSANLHRPHLTFRMNPWTPITLFAEYSLLFADTYVDNVDPTKIDNDSKFKGQHFKAAVVHDVNSYLKHYVTVQVLDPGDYYADERDKTASWFRYAVELTW